MPEAPDPFALFSGCDTHYCEWDIDPSDSSYETTFLVLELAFCLINADDLLSNVCNVYWGETKVKSLLMSSGGAVLCVRAL